MASTPRGVHRLRHWTRWAREADNGQACDSAVGPFGLHDRSSRRHLCPRRTGQVVEQQIIDLYRRERRGPDWIGAGLGVPARTVSRVLAGHRVPRLYGLDPLTGRQLPASKTAATH